MDLHQEWQALQNKTSHSSPLKAEEIMTAIYQDSKSTVAQLKKKLNTSKYISLLLIGFALINGYASRDNWAEISLMVVFLLAGIFMLWLTQQTAKRLTTDIQADATPLSWLRYNHEVLKESLAKNRLSGNILFGLLGLYFIVLKPMSWGDNFMETITSTKFLVLVPIMALIVLPIAYYLAKRSTHRSLGVHLDKLADNIKQLEEVK